MFAVNEPNVVLGGAEVRFLAPVVVGDVLTAHARRQRIEGKKIFVEVEVMRAEEKVFAGSFVCFVPARHVLSVPGAQAGGAR
jgi:acyl-coenzyme A thioesterase PaaI-like protein